MKTKQIFLQIYINFHLTLLLLLLATFSSGQNKHLSIGAKGNGICFGNSADYNGIRLNLWDKNLNRINGFNISGYVNSYAFNGLSIGLLASKDTISNGIIMGGFWAEANKHNGLAVGGLHLSGVKLNGIGISGFSIIADTLNGVFVGLMQVASLIRHDSIKVINGLAVAVGGVIASEMNGVSVSWFLNMFHKQNGISLSAVNVANELHGFQFGLINYAGNNMRFLKYIPILNFNLRKKAVR